MVFPDHTHLLFLPSWKIKELTNLFNININKNFKNTSKNVYKLIAVYLQITHISAVINFILFSFTQFNLGLCCLLWYQACYYWAI